MTWYEHQKFSPVYKAKMEILYNLDQFSTLIIIAETGSGKTT